MAVKSKMKVNVHSHMMFYNIENNDGSGPFPKNVILLVLDYEGGKLAAVRYTVKEVERMDEATLKEQGKIKDPERFKKIENFIKEQTGRSPNLF